MDGAINLVVDGLLFAICISRYRTLGTGRLGLTLARLPFDRRLPALRRLIGQRARDATSACDRTARLKVLLRANARGVLPGVRLENFLGALALGEVDIDCYLSANIIAPCDWLKNCHNPTCYLIFHLTDILDLGCVHAACPVFIRVGRKQTAIAIHNSDHRRQQLRDRRRNQVSDRRGLLIIDDPSRMQRQDHGSSRLGLITQECGGLGNREVNARIADLREGFYRIRQLRFKCPLVIHLFNKLRRTKLLIFKHFKANIAGFRKTLTGEL